MVRFASPNGSAAVTFDAEKFRGMITSVTAGTVVGMAVAASSGAPDFVLPIIYGLGHVLGYSLDIIFAKRAFAQAPGKAPVDVPYSAILKRGHLLAMSIPTLKTARFTATVFFDTLMTTLMFKITCYALKDTWLGRWRWRDAAISTVISVTTFVLYVNKTRFDYAYKDRVPLIHDVWMIIAMVAVSLAFWGPLGRLIFQLAKEAPAPSKAKQA